MNKAISKLILNTFDGNLLTSTIEPNFKDTKITFNIKYYNKDELINACLIFDNVVSIDFEINFFDNYNNSQLWGLYEIFDKKHKIAMIEKVFQKRINDFIKYGNYDYDKENENDILNSRENYLEITNNIDGYHLYEHQTLGGIFLILAKNYYIKH